ncbi:MAG: hypothetical protein WA655_00600, partial [Candidatus Korobacteraceae bacterium]
MKRLWAVSIVTYFVVIAVITVTRSSKCTAATNTPAMNVRLDSVNEMEVIEGTARMETYRGRRAVHLSQLPNHTEDDSPLAILGGSDFKDGTIEVEVAGSPKPGTDPGNRGFIGLAFRVRDHGSKAEYFYLRPTNGRSDDQLRRNHSVQYESLPDFPWYRLRKENPGVYESYVDLQPGVWTKMKVVVSGAKAQIYVNDAEQPCLIVNDLKLGESRGQIALWAYGGTDG